ncbi:MAG: FAD-dependent oxidoreductase, partial [Candidatus Bathyarchaeota archaeon]
MSVKWLIESERRTAVLYDVDVVVVGGGTAGPVAAIAAARTGASTVLIERFGSLGGVPTVGKCFHVGNAFLDDQMRRVIDGIPVEIFERVVKEGGSRYPTFEETIYGKTKPPTLFLIDPEILAVVLMDMVEEAGVKLLLHTYFCDPVMDGNTMKGVVVQNKSGRKAVLAKIVVDTSGEADVAFQAGVPCKSYPKEGTYGLLMHIGNVDHERFMEYVLRLPADQPDPEFSEWLSQRVGSPIEDLKKHRYWSRFLDPLRVGQGLPRNHPGRTHFSSKSLEWYREKWEVEKEFTYVHMNYFRDKLREAVDNGDLELLRQIDDIGNVVFNLDGATGSKFRKREVVMNVITPIGFDAFDSERITKTEIAAHRRALEVSRFLKKYMPGFEESYITATGVQTMPRHIRMI